MSEDMGRIAALEEKVAALETTLREQRSQGEWPAAPVSKTDSRPVTRRKLMRSGSAAAVGAAAGAMVACSQPAGTAQRVSGSDMAPGGVVTEGRFYARPWYDIRGHGAIGDGYTDDTAAIRDAVNVAANFGGGTILVPPGQYRFSGQIVIPEGVDIWGCGGHRQAGTQIGTVLRARGPAAQIVVQGEGGQSGNLLISGHPDVSPEKGLVHLHGTTERIFTALRVADTANDGIVAERVQNCSFLQLEVFRCHRDGLVLDTFSENNVFLRSELTGSVNNNLTIRHTDIASGLNPPNRNHFIKCLIERGLLEDGEWTGPNNSQMTVTAGYDNLFTACGFHLAKTHPMPASGFLVVVDGDTSVTFENCQFGSSVDGVGALHVRDGDVGFQGHCSFATGNSSNPGRGIVWETTRTAHVAGVMDFRDNSGWEVLGRRYQRAPFETGYMRVNSQDDTTFVPKLDGAQAAIYVKDGKLVVAYKDGARMRYRTMPLTGTSTEWSHSAAAP